MRLCALGGGRWHPVGHTSDLGSAKADCCPPCYRLACSAEFPLASMVRRSAAAACIPPSSDTQLQMSGALALQTSRMMRSWSAATARRPPCMASTTAQRLLVVAAAAAAAGGEAATASSPVTTTAGPGAIIMGGARMPASLSRMRRSCAGSEGETKSMDMEGGSHTTRVSADSVDNSQVSTR